MYTTYLTIKYNMNWNYFIKAKQSNKNNFRFISQIIFAVNNHEFVKIFFNC